MGIRLAKIAAEFMRFFPESNSKTAMPPIPESFSPSVFGVNAPGSTRGITKKKGSFSMKNSMRFIVLSLFVLCVSFTAFAQTSSTGTIEGNVVDQNGAAVPGAIVTVKGPNLITPQTATSDESGRYRIANLPPGRYEVAIAAAGGFAEFTRSDVQVNLSSTSEVNISLVPAG